jgi:hypothetical protein
MTVEPCKNCGEPTAICLTCKARIHVMISHEWIQKENGELERVRLEIRKEPHYLVHLKMHESKFTWVRKKTPLPRRLWA